MDTEGYRGDRGIQRIQGRQRLQRIQGRPRETEGYKDRGRQDETDRYMEYRGIEEEIDEYRWRQGETTGDRGGSSLVKPDGYARSYSLDNCC